MTPRDTPLADLRLERDVPAVVVDDAMDHRQAHPRAATHLLDHLAQRNQIARALRHADRLAAAKQFYQLA